jgi:signal transduction histidine kinase
MPPPSPAPEAGPTPRLESSTNPGAQRLRMSLVFAATILLLYPLDLLILRQHSSPATLVTRLLWVLEVGLYTWALRVVDARWAPRLTILSNTLTCAFLVSIAWFTGGRESPYFVFMPTMPLLTALTHPHDSRPMLGGGAVCALGTLGMLVAEGLVVQAVCSTLLVGVAMAFGLYGAAQFRKAQAAENEARLERARRESLEKLALAESHRTQSEKLATVGRLAASVMHEINNPLAFVCSNLEFLRAEVLEQPALPEEARGEWQEVFDETRTGVERIRQIVSDLKGFSRMDAEEPSECALADVVNDAARLAAVRLKYVAKLKVEVPAELPEVFATRRKLAQVILNLLVNAGDALEDAKVQGGEVRVRGLAGEERVTLLVEDNGPGIPPESLPRLFEAFYTTKGPEKGTGLGLSISRELVERFGGTLSAENRREGGACLRLELPVHNPTPSNNTPLSPGE